MRQIIKFAVLPMLFLLWITVGNQQAASAAIPLSGFAWTNNEASALNVPYTPNATYAYNPTGGAITITRTGTGLYTVVFTGLGAATTGASGPGNGGNVQVSTYDGGTLNKYIAKIRSWNSLGNDFIVYVRTQKVNGPASNSKFSVLVNVP